jgi:hypothetical protein
VVEPLKEGSDMESEAFIPGLEEEPASQSATGRGTFTPVCLYLYLALLLGMRTEVLLLCTLIFETLADIISV